MWYKVKKIYIWDKQVRPAVYVQTFDFQNDWALSWTWYSIWYWTPSLVSWQWWSIGSSDNTSNQWWLVIPQSVFDWKTLKSIKFYWYKPSISQASKGVAVWLCSQDQSTLVDYSRTRYASTDWVGCIIRYPWWVKTQAIDPTGEITTEYIMEDNWDLVVDVNWTTYNLWQYASIYQTLWSNKTLYIVQWRWSATVSYIRKIVITTK